MLNVYIVVLIYTVVFDD